MRKASGVLVAALAALVVSGAARAQESAINGVYRIDPGASDRLYTVVAGASSNLPFGEQQRFFIDLAVRLTPPDLLAIERRGQRVYLGSSRAARITLVADGLMRTERTAAGRSVRSRVSFEGGKLSFSSSGQGEDNFSVIFASVDGGRRLRVTRRISAEQLSEPLVIQTVYDKISETPRWDLYGDALLAAADAKGGDSTRPPTPRPGGERDEADTLRGALTDWIEATKARDLEAQMRFYMPELKAFYLTRNVPRAAVRREKARVFTSAERIEIMAAEPEIIFTDAGRQAVMRFRKKYDIEDGRRSRRGEVVQELRWRRTDTGWRIFSERDIRVIR